MIAENVLKMEQNYIRIQEENARLRTLLGEDLSKPMDCEHCRFFIQHYIRCGFKQYIKTYAGHCAHGRTKDRKPNDSCKYFEAGQWK